jgi:hypothetical protein
MARNLRTGRAFKACSWHDEIVVLISYGDEAQPVLACEVSMVTPPIRATLGDRRGYGIVRLGLRPVAGWARATQQAIDQDARAAAGVAADHETARFGEHLRHSRLKRSALEAAIAI